MPILVDSSSSQSGTALNLRPGLWVNVADNPADLRHFRYLSALEFDKTVQGEVRQLANGTRRVVRRAGHARGGRVTLTGPRADLDWLDQNAGETMCFRDDAGRKFYGVFFEAPFSERSLPRGRPEVALQITSVTFSEAV